MSVENLADCHKREAQKQMKIFYVGDFRALPNWGCRSTGVALAEMLSSNHTIVYSVGVESLHYTGWGQYAEPSIRYGGIMPRRVYDLFWRARKRFPRLADRYFEIERKLGSKFDFICESPDESVECFHRARKHNLWLNQFYDALEDADAVVFNGEGTMIFSTPARRDVLFNLFMISLAKSLGKKVFFVNAMFSDCTNSSRNDATAHLTAQMLEKCDAVACRDGVSYEFVRESAPSAHLSAIPDALFSWKSRVQGAAQQISLNPDVILPYGFEKLIGKFNFSMPYICLSGSSGSRQCRNRYIEAYSQVAKKLMAFGHPLYLVCTCQWDDYLIDVGRMLSLPVIPYQIPVMAGAAILANARVFVSGRFHPSILASLGGTPCVFLSSNSHKTLSLQAVLKYPRSQMFSDVPSDDEAEQIRCATEHYLESGQTDRQRIDKVTLELSLNARQVLDVLDGRQFVSIL